MGIGAEVAAKIVELAFDHLDAPPARVAQLDVPLPYAANLEALSLPSVDRIVQAAKAVGVKADSFREFRIRKVSEALAKKPELVDKVYVDIVKGK